jgi:uncharacterized membrane protein
MNEEEISKLSEEVATLKDRISALEQLLGPQLRAEAAPRPEAVSVPPQAPPPPQPAPQPARRRADSSELEAEIGGNWLNKIGAVALVLGIAFFLKYAIDNRWINETGRIVIGIVIGLVCIYGGEYFQRKNLPKYAQGLSGAGIAILYFTIYAAFAFYRLVPQLPAFAFMVLITITAIALSVRHNAVVIAILGIIGGFLTPVLIRQPGGGGGDSQIELFTYIAVLNLGVLGVTRYRGWRELNLLSFAGTVIVFAGWFGDYYVPAKLGLTMLFLTIFYAIFAAQSFVQNVVARRPMNASDLFMVIATPILYFAVSYSLLAREHYVYLGAFAVVMAAVYLVFTQRVHIAGYEDKKLRLLFLSIAAAFLTIAIPIQLRKHWITIGWAAEGAILAWLGFYLSSPKTRYVAMGLLGLAAIRLLFLDTFAAGAKDLTPFLNERFLTFLFAIVMAILVAALYARYREQITGGESAFPAILLVGANSLLIWALSQEALSLVERMSAAPFVAYSVRSLVLSAVWAIYAVLMLAAGILWKYRPVRIMAVVIFGIIILKSFLFDVWTLERVYRIIAFVGLGVLLLVASYVYQANRDRIRQIMRGDEQSHA